MLTTIGAICVTLAGFILSAVTIIVGFGIALIVEIGVLASQIYHAVTPYLAMGWNWIITLA